jgi:hypothetical protein
MALHNSLSANDMHTLIRWSHADAAARQAQSVTAADVGKLSLQLDNGSFWLYDGTWRNISGLGVTFAHPLNMWPRTDVVNTWYGPEFWQSISDGSFNIAFDFGSGADPALGGNYRLLGVRVPFDCILERIDLFGFPESLTVDMELRWYKFSATDDTVSLGAGTQVGQTTQIGPNEPNMRDYSQDPAAVLDRGDFLVPFFRDAAYTSPNGQFMGQLVFREILT